MTLYLNKWTLGIEGGTIPRKYIEEDEIHSLCCMKGITLLSVLLTIYDIFRIFVFHDCVFDDLVKESLLSFIPDSIMVVVTTVFFIILPYFKCYFHGIAAIPLIISVLATVETTVICNPSYGDVAS